MPDPRRGESMADYIHRYMGSSEAEVNFPKAKQRFVVAKKTFERARRKRK